MACGICIADATGFVVAFAIAGALAVASAVILAALAIWRPSVTLIAWKRRLRLLPVTALAISLGIALMATRLPAELHIDPHETIAARIETIALKEQSMKIEATLLTTTTGKNITGERVMIYTAGCDYLLSAGDVIAFPNDLSPIITDGNPASFDYPSHFRRLGIGYRQFINADDLIKIGTFDTFKTRIARYRRAAEHAVMSLDGLSPRARRLVIALVLGNDDYIDPDVRDDFSAAGIAHVLALSGLHIAIIAMLVLLVLYPLDYAGHKRLRLLATLLLIAGYAVFTGLSPSVVRAAIMTGVVTWAFYVYRKTTLADALCLSALLTLAFRPGDLFSAGFWMSYFSVATIGVVSATVLPLMQSRWRVVNYFIGIVVVSLAAMIATSPISMHCFNTIAPLGVVANVLVLPLFPVVMIACILTATLAACGIEWQWLDAVVNGAESAISSVASTVAHICYNGHLGYNYISFTVMVLAIAAIVLALLWLMWRQHRHLIVAIIAAAIAFGLSLVHIANIPSSGIILLNDSRYTPLIAYSGDTAVVWAPFDKRLEPSQFLRHNRNLLASLGVDRVGINPDSLNARRPRVEMQYAIIGNKRFLALGGGHWRDKRLYAHRDTTQFHTHYAIATRRFHGTLDAARRFVDFDTLIISGNVYPDRRAEILAACDSLSIPVIDIATTGALVF